MCDENKFLSGKEQSIHFGTVHLGLKQDRQSAPNICFGVVDARPPHEHHFVLLDRDDAASLAHWTKTERHDFVIVSAANDFCREAWTDFGVQSGARSYSPLYQPFKVLLPSAVAALDSDSSAVAAVDSGRIQHVMIPTWMYLYGGHDYLRHIIDKETTPSSTFDIGQLKDQLMSKASIPQWKLNQRANPNRTHLGAVNVKAVEWSKCPKQVIQFTVWMGGRQKGRKDSKRDPNQSRGGSFQPKDDFSWKNNDASNSQSKGKGTCKLDRGDSSAVAVNSIKSGKQEAERKGEYQQPPPLPPPPLGPTPRTMRRVTHRTTHLLRTLTQPSRLLTACLMATAGGNNTAG